MLDIYCGRAHRLWEPMLAELSRRHREGREITLLVPEQFTLQAERELMLALQVKGFFRLQVLSPSRLQYRVFERYGADPRVRIDERGKAMALSRALQQVRDELSYYLGAEGRPGFVRKMSALLALMKGGALTAEQLLQAAEDMEGEGLRRKLKDTARILAAYEAVLEGSFCDAQDIHHDMLRRLSQGHMFAGSHVFVYGFDVVTEAMQDLLLPLSFQAESLSLYMVSEKEQAPDGDAFLAVRTSIQRLMQAFTKRGLPYRFHWLPPSALTAPGQISHLERYMLALRQPAYQEAGDAIRLYAAATPYQEVQQVAMQLLLALEDGLNPQDALVLCGSLPRYSGLIAAAFGEWGIPCYIFDKSPLLAQPLSRYALAALRCLSDHWRADDVRDLLRSGFSPLTDREGQELENYALEFGIRGSHWLKPFHRGEEARLQRMEALRQRLAAPLEALQAALAAAKNAAQSLEALHSFLLASDVPARSDAMEEALRRAGLYKQAMELAQAWPMLQEMMAQMEALMGEQRIPLKHFARWLESGLSEGEIASLPPESLRVQVGQLGNLLPHRPKQVFLLGLNEGILDADDEALLSAEEAQRLEESLDTSLGLQRGAREELKLLDLWKMMSAPEERLYLSYALANEEGGVLQPLPQIAAIRRLFPLMVEEGGALADDSEAEPLAPAPALNALAQRLQGGALSPAWQDAWAWLWQDARWGESARALLDQLGGERLSSSIPRELASLVFRPERSSVSRLETFGACPYRHFVEYGLRPQPRPEWQVEPIDTGGFYHDAMEGFVRLASVHGRWPQVEGPELERMMDEVLTPLTEPWEERPFHDTARLRKVAEGYVAISRRMMRTLTLAAKNADLQPIRAELRFGEGEELPALRLPISGGRQMQLRGVIDRLDFYHGDPSYIRVVDYKSGHKALSGTELDAGTQLQLLVYLSSAMAAYPDALPAGVYYQYLGDPIIATEDESKVEDAIFRELQLKGLTLKDPQAVLLQDRERPLSLGSLINRDGSLSRRQRFYSLEEIRLLSGHALRRAGESARRIAEGDIERLPTRDRYGQSPCRYCHYAGICRIDRLRFPSYRQLPHLSMGELAERLWGQPDDK